MFDIGAHLERVLTQSLSTMGPGKVAEWITQNTYLGGAPFSFKGHEYQLRILRSSAPLIAVKKCSQVGISELMARRVLALSYIMPKFDTIMTFPTTDFARKFTATRVDPIIHTSPALSSALGTSNDNTEVKQIGDNFIYIRGTFGNNQAISIPADMIASDEVDFSNQEALSNFQSRLTHSKYRWLMRVSTPTVAGRGIDEEFSATRRHFNFVQCSCCGHFFYPDYLKHVKIPGFDRHLLEVTKEMLPRIRWKEAALTCPSCGGVPDLSPGWREWVCENNDEQHEGEGFQLSPFDAPEVISVPYLIEASTRYTRKVDFINFNLGQCAEDSDSSFTEADLAKCYALEPESGFYGHVMGVDMGTTCHVVIGGVDGWGRLHVVHTEVVHYTQISERYLELARRYRVVFSVMDSQPYVETVYKLQRESPVLHGAVYITSKSLEPMTLRGRTGDEGAGLLEVRQLNINRNRAFDAFLEFVRSGKLGMRPDANRAALTEHFTDMKRVRDVSSEVEAYVWQKSKEGNDHFLHASLYCWAAAQMKGVSTSQLILPPMVGSFKLRGVAR